MTDQTTEPDGQYRARIVQELHAAGGPFENADVEALTDAVMAVRDRELEKAQTRWEDSRKAVRHLMRAMRRTSETEEEHVDRTTPETVRALVDAIAEALPDLEPAEERDFVWSQYRLAHRVLNRQLVRVSAEARQLHNAANARAEGLKADWSRYRGSVLQEARGRMRDAGNIDAMQVINDMLEEPVPVEGEEFKVAGGWGVDGAEDAEDARRKVREALAAYPGCGAYAERRVTRMWDDGAEYYGPWQPLDPADTEASR